MEHGNNEKHEQTDKSVKKLGNKRKRKMVEPLKVHIFFSLNFPFQYKNTFNINKYRHFYSRNLG